MLNARMRQSCFTGCPGLETCREREMDIREKLRDTGSTCSPRTCTWARANYEYVQNTKFVRKFAQGLRESKPFLTNNRRSRNHYFVLLLLLLFETRVLSQ